MEERPTLSKTKAEREGHPRGFCGLNAPPANRSSVSDSVDPSFLDYRQDQGQTKVFLHFASLKNTIGTSRLFPGPTVFAIVILSANRRLRAQVAER